MIYQLIYERKAYETMRIRQVDTTYKDCAVHQCALQIVNRLLGMDEKTNSRECDLEIHFHLLQ